MAFTNYQKLKYIHFQDSLNGFVPVFTYSLHSQRIHRYFSLKLLKRSKLVTLLYYLACTYTKLLQHCSSILVLQHCTRKVVSLQNPPSRCLRVHTLNGTPSAFICSTQVQGHAEVMFLLLLHLLSSYSMLGDSMP